MTLLRSFALGAALLAGASSAHATTYYWDTNGTDPNFGTASGTWGSSPFWSTSPAGTATPTAVDTTLDDDLHFGTDSVALNAGTIAVSGTVEAGSLTFGSAGTQDIVLNGGVINLAAASTITVNKNSRLNSELNGVDLHKAGNSVLRLGGDNSGLTGTISINAGQIALYHANAGSANAAWSLTASGTGLRADVAEITVHLGSLSGVSGSTLRAAVGNGVQTFSIGALGTDTTFAGNITDTDGTAVTAITKVGAGTLTLTGTGNTYSGPTLISDGTLQIGAGGVASFGSSAITNNANLAFNSTSAITVSGAISGAGALTKAGSANLTLTGDNTGMTGNVTINGGQIALGNVNAGTNAAWHVASGATLGAANSTLGAGNHTLHIGSLSGDVGATLRNGGGANGIVTFSIGGLGTDTTFEGNVINNHSDRRTGIAKVGAGSLTLTGNGNAYDGGTTVNAGALLANNTSGSGTGVGVVTVESNGILGGTGFIAPLGANAVSVSGALAPGDGGVGTLTFNFGSTTGGLNLLSGATLLYDVGAPGVSDLIRIYGFTPGDVAFNNNAIFFAGDLEPDGVYTLFEFFSDNGATPIDHGLTGGLILGGGVDGAILYNGNLIQLQMNSIVPEPGALWLLTPALLGFGVVAYRQKRRNT